MATIRDVAALAKVSPTTVSIVANGKEKERRIPDVTVKRVLAAMEELHYRPNQTARYLRGQTPEQPSVAFYWPLDYRTNILGARLNNLKSQMLEKHYDFNLVVQTYVNGHIEDSVKPILEGRYDGVILGASSNHDLEYLESLSIRTPLILLNRQSRKFSTVGTSDSQIGMKMASLIQKKGYKSCALIQTSDRYAGIASRTKSFLYSCRQFDIEVRPEWCITGVNTIVGGAQATDALCQLKSPPKMIVYESDCMAQGGICSLKKHNRRIPRDAEVLAVGTQEPESMQYLVPSISCVSIPINVDRMAMDTLAMIMEQSAPATMHLELEPLVQLRESFQL